MTTKPIVVSDATPLIALAKIGQLSWLRDLFDNDSDSDKVLKMAK